ncbi:FxLYD domain-containing protein [Streptomyces sp. SBR177]
MGAASTRAGSRIASAPEGADGQGRRILLPGADRSRRRAGHRRRRPRRGRGRRARTDAHEPPGRSQQEERGARGDVRITACTVDPVTKWPSAELAITNRSSKPSNYVVQVEFVDASGKRLSEAYASTNGLRPGQEAAVTAQSLDQVSVKVTCRVTDVTRYAS